MRKLNIPFDQIKAHYELEKKLSNQLRKASVSERKNLYNDTYNEVYSKVSYLLPLQRKLSSSELRNYLKMLGPYLNKDITFLEIGPGNCILSFAVSKRVKFVYAVDVSTEVTKNSQSPQNFKLIISDGTNIPVPQASINFAYSNQLMEHLHPEDAYEQLKAIYQALKKGGKYLCITPNRISGPHDVSQYFDEVATGFHLKEYTVSELVEILKNVGFRKCTFLLGTKGYFFEFPYRLIVVVENILELLPFFIRKRVARFLPIRILLGIKILAQK
jgi:SAM-dependent methyltransferase